MILSKRRIAVLVKRFPVALRILHSLWRRTRPRFSAGVTGVVFNPLGEILIVEHVYHAEPRWGLPGGYVDRGEDLDTALARELAEELGLPVEVGRVLLVERSAGNHLDIAYLCHTAAPVESLSDELLDYRWLAPDDLPRLRPFQQRAIQVALDAMSVTDVMV